MWTGEGCKLLVAKTKLRDMHITGCVLILFTTQDKRSFRGANTPMVGIQCVTVT